MPIYEYFCQECNEIFEELIFGLSKDEEIVCPKCNKKKSERLISACASNTNSDFEDISRPSGGCGHGGFT